jgi:hypothetical protein
VIKEISGDDIDPNAMMDIHVRCCFAALQRCLAPFGDCHAGTKHLTCY